MAYHSVEAYIRRLSKKDLEFLLQQYTQEDIGPELHSVVHTILEVLKEK